ncbi:hypothetical protein [Bordetella sp. N]|uniref:hypothetical protein n=1 Tax=Bordetella sp. N TaxID=1746199 RepID=UPI00070AC2C0|nr:hypothetical protein [Bordetella sp. N]ALM82961.1 hypothetical protein ASB57_08330 [Bordetella sp. N]
METTHDQDAGATLARRFIAKAQGYARPRRCNVEMLVRFGATPVHVSVRDGRVRQAAVITLPLDSWDFGLSADADAWQRFWAPVPAPGWHDIFALSKRGALRIDGNLQPLMANLQFVKDLVALGREDA